MRKTTSSVGTPAALRLLAGGKALNICRTHRITHVAQLCPKCVEEQAAEKRARMRHERLLNEIARWCPEDRIAL